MILLCLQKEGKKPSFSPKSNLTHFQSYPLYSWPLGYIDSCISTFHQFTQIQPGRALTWSYCLPGGTSLPGGTNAVWDLPPRHRVKAKVSLQPRRPAAPRLYFYCPEDSSPGRPSGRRTPSWWNHCWLRGPQQWCTTAGSEELDSYLPWKWQQGKLILWNKTEKVLLLGSSAERTPTSPEKSLCSWWHNTCRLHLHTSAGPIPRHHACLQKWDQGGAVKKRGVRVFNHIRKGMPTQTLFRYFTVKDKKETDGWEYLSPSMSAPPDCSSVCYGGCPAPRTTPQSGGNIRSWESRCEATPEAQSSLDELLPRRRPAMDVREKTSLLFQVTQSTREAKTKQYKTSQNDS